jgi:uncharacterized protein (TIGR03435 family)
VHSRIVACAVSVLVLPFGVLAQNAFDVASVKRNTTGNSGWSISYTADSLHATNATLSALIQSAYGVLLESRLVGGPSWVRTTRFDVHAKAGRSLPREQLRLMTQRLLEDRFGVALTREQRQQEVYALRVARADGRTGPDLRRAAEGCLDNPTPTTTPRSSTAAAPTTWGWCTTMGLMATGLSRSLRFAVVDQTGLSGRWDFVLAFTALTADATPAAEPGQTVLPTVFVAVQEQLGLKLERDARGSVEFVVIAAAHAPTEN